MKIREPDLRCRRERIVFQIMGGHTLNFVSPYGYVCDFLNGQ